jgi:hypothetical protein
MLDTPEMVMNEVFVKLIQVLTFKFLKSCRTIQNSRLNLSNWKKINKLTDNSFIGKKY